MDGALIFGRYAIEPKQDGFCIAGKLERSCSNLDQFDGARSYLSLIAQANNIANFFDWRVAEAYWLGNHLLERVSPQKFYLFMKKNTQPSLFVGRISPLINKIPLGAKPNHFFQVLEYVSGSGDFDLYLPQTIKKIDDCRISWGKIKDIEPDHFLVEGRKLEYARGKLDLSIPSLRKIKRLVNDRSYLAQAHIGDWLTSHWHWANDIISENQAQNLERFTKINLEVVNK